LKKNALKGQNREPTKVAAGIPHQGTESMKMQRNSMYNLKNPINLHQILKKFLKKHLPKKKALPKGATSILPQIPIPT